MEGEFSMAIEKNLSRDIAATIRSGTQAWTCSRLDVCAGSVVPLNSIVFRTSQPTSPKFSCYIWNEVAERMTKRLKCEHVKIRDDTCSSRPYQERIITREKSRQIKWHARDAHDRWLSSLALASSRCYFLRHVCVQL